MAVFSDLAWYFAVFFAAWVIFFVAHIALVKLGFVEGVGAAVVILAVCSAIVAGGVSFIIVASHLSSSGTAWVVGVGAPICFLGFVGVYLNTILLNCNRSITYTILSTIDSVDGSPLSTDRLMGMVPFDRIYRKRLREMSAARIITVESERIQITVRGGKVFGFYRRLGILLNIKPQEQDLQS